MKHIWLSVFLLFFYCAAFGQFSRQDTLRGSDGRGRDWWDVTRYDLSIKFDTGSKSISGFNKIGFKYIGARKDSMQIDMQEPMVIDSIEVGENDAKAEQIVPMRTFKNVPREGNVYWLIRPPGLDTSFWGEHITVYFHGSPRIAVKPPWDGGFIWTKDSTGNPWIAVACQGLGASAWWPCKDYQGDEPEQTHLRFDVPSGLQCVSNGRLTGTGVSTFMSDTKPYIDSNYRYWSYDVVNPINSYDITFYIGDYVSWTDTIMGEKGKLDVNFSVLRENEARAREHFKVVKQMLHCYEYWMGSYPFYEDGYKLVEAPYLGMEHQSAVAYGNKYLMGYLGRDRSGTGVGMNFDYIIVHESGHEWFGNNITAKDIADNWLHEGFTTYAETLFAECLLGKEKAFEFCRGEWKNIRNDKPIIGVYGVQDDGSGDKYDKGAALLHTIRMIINDDEKFRQLLRGLNRDFYHQTVTSAEVEAYISKFAGYDFTAIFNEYLRTTMIPQLEYYVKHKKLFYRFTDVVGGFTLPMDATSGKMTVKIQPQAEWQHVKWKRRYDVRFSNNFLYKVK